MKPTQVFINLTQLERDRLDDYCREKGIGRGPALAEAWAKFESHPFCRETEFCQITGALLEEPGPRHSVACMLFRESEDSDRSED